MNIIALLVIVAGFTALWLSVLHSVWQVFPYRTTSRDQRINRYQWEFTKFTHYIRQFNSDTPGEELLQQYNTIQELEKENQRLGNLINKYDL
jgi:hypothetical protein